MREFLREVEAGLSDVCDRLSSEIGSTERDAALVLAVLSLLAASRRREDRVAEEEVPYIVNFERAKAELLARRASDALEREREYEFDRPRLRVFYGE